MLSLYVALAPSFRRNVEYTVCNLKNGLDKNAHFSLSLIVLKSGGGGGSPMFAIIYFVTFDYLSLSCFSVTWSSVFMSE